MAAVSSTDLKVEIVENKASQIKQLGPQGGESLDGLFVLSQTWPLACGTAEVQVAQRGDETRKRLSIKNAFYSWTSSTSDTEGTADAADISQWI